MIFEHWSAAANRLRERPSEERDGKARPAQAYLQAISSTTEEVQASDFGGGRMVEVTHPAMGIRSWIRYMPEEGSSVVVTQRSDTAVPEILYYSGSTAAVKVAAYLNRKGHYRQLTPGETEISSYGFAQAFWSRRGTLHMRGGITRGWLSHDELEVGFKAPTHRRLLHDHIHDDALVGEERYGLVWRKGDDHTERVYVKKDGSYAREYVRTLNFEGAPAVLVDYREGHVHDEEGEELLSPIGSPLRVRGRWYNQDGDEYVSQQIDHDGNVWWKLPNDATTGWTLQIPKGTFRLEAGEKVQIGARSDVEFTGRNMTIRARGTLSIWGAVAVNIGSDGAVVIDAPNVTLKGRAVTDLPTVI